MRFSLLGVAALVCLIASPLVAEDSEIRTQAQIKMDQFKSAHPDARFHGQQYFDDEGFFEMDNTADFIYGTVLATGDTPVNSAWNFYNQIDGIYAEEVGDLLPGKVLGVMWNRETQSHRFSTFRFQQAVSGIPVYRSGIGFLVRNEKGFPVVMTSNNLKEMQGFVPAADVVPKLTEAMRRTANRFLDDSAPYIGGIAQKSVLDVRQRDKQVDLEISGEELVIWAGNTNVKVEPEMGIKFMAKRGTVADPDNYRKYMMILAVDDGEILHYENQISTLDVDGTVSGNATDNGATFSCGPEVGFGLPYAGVEIIGGVSGFADVQGNFDLSSGNGNVTVRSRLRGQYFQVFDQSAGNSTPFIDIDVTSPDSVDILFNPSPADQATANINAYLHTNIVRDYVLSFEPSFPTIANQTFFATNTNIGSNCNAFYDGSSTNYFTAGGGCNNTAFGDVVYHEYGHHLVNVTGNSQGQFGEGSGDAIGVLIEDDPVLGQGFQSCGNGIRSATNFRTYPCFDQNSPHDCGQLLSGVVWDTLNEIRAVDPSNARDITSSLFIGMLIVRGQMGGASMIGPEITLIFLELDDDDGNIGNGTPHYNQIATAFNAHNMMAPELDPVIIEFPNGVPTIINPAGGDSFEVQISGSTSTAVPDSGVLHVNDGNGFVQVPMTVVNADTYTAVFPATTCGALVEFFVSVEAESGETATNPTDAPADVLEALSAVDVTSVFLDSFDSNLGWTVSGNATDGQWQRGIPNNGDRGDPSADAEDTGAGNCYVTDNGNTPGDDNSDVDGGSTTLTSPVLDASTGEDQEAFLSYYRWYSNDFGASPNADTFVIEISNNGGSSWTSLETVGPTGPETGGGWFFKQFRIADILPPTANMRVRFTASDLGDGSVIEAAVDAVQIELIDCAQDVLHGDVNGDGVVNLLDVQPFVDILTAGGFLPEADVNKDGLVNLLDVAGFVELLSGG